jgi:Integrase zinc binding domain
VEGSVLCERCLEVVAVVDEEGTASKEEESEMRAAQVAEFGDLNIARLKAPDLLLNEAGILCKLISKTVRVVVPDQLREKMLAKVHGSRSLGHWGVVRTAVATSRRYWWDGWLKDVEEYVKKCVACAMAKLGSSGRRQTRIIRYTPARRFETVALDITQISPSGRKGAQKVVEIGDMKSRFVLAVPCKDEHEETLSKNLWERWFAVFGPPEHLLTDLGKPLVSAIMRNLWRARGCQEYLQVLITRSAMV